VLFKLILIYNMCYLSIKLAWQEFFADSRFKEFNGLASW